MLNSNKIKCDERVAQYYIQILIQKYFSPPLPELVWRGSPEQQ